MKNLEALQNSVLKLGKYAILFDLMNQPTEHLITSLEQFEKCEHHQLCEGINIILESRGVKVLRLS